MQFCCWKAQGNQVVALGKTHFAFSFFPLWFSFHGDLSPWEAIEWVWWKQMIVPRNMSEVAGNEEDVWEEIEQKAWLELMWIFLDYEMT